MLVLLSPAKSLDFESDAPTDDMSLPYFEKEALYLGKLASELSLQQLQALMEISPKLAELNYQRFQAIRHHYKNTEKKQAIFAFDGDVYDGLQAKLMTRAQIQYVNQHVCILSGLFGVLKPLDGIVPYRLEMGRKLANQSGASLYDFWQPRNTQFLQQYIQKNHFKSVINCASQEYAASVRLDELGVPVIHLVFEDKNKQGEYKILAFHAKKARGHLLRFCAERKITNAEKLWKTLHKEGMEAYQLQADLSDETRWVLRRG